MQWEADLPELQLAGDAQLLEPRLQVQLQRLRQAQVRPVTLVLPPAPGTDLLSAVKEPMPIETSADEFTRVCRSRLRLALSFVRGHNPMLTVRSALEM